MHSRLIAIAGAALTASCAPSVIGYAPENANGRAGYAEQALGQSRYQVTFSAPSGTPEAEIDRLPCAAPPSSRSAMAMACSRSSIGR